MSKTQSRRFPVTITHLPVTRCQICRRTVAYRPGTLSQTLTEHYRRAHPSTQRPARVTPHHPRQAPCQAGKAAKRRRSIVSGPHEEPPPSGAG